MFRRRPAAKQLHGAASSEVLSGLPPLALRLPVGTSELNSRTPAAYDLGYFELEQKTLQPLTNPFGTRLSPLSLVRPVTYVSGLDAEAQPAAHGEPSTAVGAVTGSQPTGGSVSLSDEDLMLVIPPA
ncbi:hypothetical protein [Bradyrhizobium sp.]|uniref:hypothetical protein n=1 Tax=Bradyrhizobium sp. TaxID=376 RepID=UPI003C73C65F